MPVWLQSSIVKEMIGLLSTMRLADNFVRSDSLNSASLNWASSKTASLILHLTNIAFSSFALPKSACLRLQSDVNTVMNNACMRAAEILNCSFCNAEMKNLDAIMAKIYLSSFEGANLKEAAFTSSRIEYSVFDDANIECATTINTAIGECSFVGSNLFGINFSETYLNNKSIELIRKARAFDLNNLVR